MSKVKIGNIRGPKGEQGPQGIQGVQGPQGPQGIQGEKGDDGRLILDTMGLSVVNGILCQTYIKEV